MTTIDGPSEARRPVLAAVAAGDRSAFAALFDRLSPAVLAAMQARSADPARAEQATAAVFLEIWRQAPRFRPDEESPSAFVVRIVDGFLGRTRTVRDRG